ncbi:MAG: hypothetical protein LBK99_13965 [Opitutaceae bacterium]|jgi:hypothetical protein|nr:hypothetical protein [Opitutaceae bacterium]
MDTPSLEWEFEDNVLRGTIDNRVKGRISARVWFAGRVQPMEIELAGNAAPDLQGRRLAFFTRLDTPAPAPLPANMKQKGAAGLVTASHKDKIADIPRDEIESRLIYGKPVPWHMGNVLYLEWFTPDEGRMLVTGDFRTEFRDDGPAWEFTEDDEAAALLARTTAPTSIADPDAATAARQEDAGTREIIIPTEAEIIDIREKRALFEDRYQFGLPNLHDTVLNEHVCARIEMPMQIAFMSGNERLTIAKYKGFHRSMIAHSLKHGPDPARRRPVPRHKAWKRPEYQCHHPLGLRADELHRTTCQRLASRGGLPPDLAATFEEQCERLLDDLFPPEGGRKDFTPVHPIMALLGAALQTGFEIPGIFYSYRQVPPPRRLAAEFVVDIDQKCLPPAEKLVDAIHACQREGFLDAVWLEAQEASANTLLAGLRDLIASLREWLNDGSWQGESFE